MRLSHLRRRLGPGWLTVVLALAALGESCRTERDIQRDIARDLLTPAPVAPPSTDPSASPARSLRVRVYVDQEYQRENLHWRSKVEAQFERANQLLAPQFGIRLTVAEIRHWVWTSPSRDLRGALHELVETDAGAGVDWVVGYVPASTAIVPGSLETLGMGSLFGKHLVVRSMVMTEDRQEIERRLHALPEAEREKVMVDRRLHRETVVLLHEWAHTLGAFHDRDNDSIMSPTYDKAAYRFTEAQLRIVQLGLSHRRSTEPDALAAWAREYRAQVERARAEAWSEDTVTEALASASRLESTRPAASPPPPVPSPAASPATTVAAPRGSAARTDVSTLIEADLADRLGDPARAWALAAPMVARLPRASYLQAWGCDLQRRARVRGGRSCRAGSPLSPSVLAVLFVHVLVERGDRTEVVAAAARAEQSLAAASRPSSPLAWAELADALSSIGACTSAERNVARAPDHQLAVKAGAACARTRSRALLPRDAAGVPVEREAEYVAEVLAGRRALEERRLDDALSAAFALERSFPDAAGGAWLRCAASARRPDGGAAAACRAAEQAAPWAPELAALLGLAEGNQKRWPEARDALRRALERDPLDLESWQRLGYALDQLGDAPGLEDLRRRHQEKFGLSLAPEW